MSQNKKTETIQRQDKQKDIRRTNINAAKDVVRSSLGPRGMDKMIQDSKGEVLITNDGATIMKQLEVMHPTAKMMVELSKSQDIEAGDGTTTVVVLAGELLQECEFLLDKGIHPTQISEGFQLALEKSMEILNKVEEKISLKDKPSIVHCVNTALASKVVSTNSQMLSPMAVDAVLKIIDVEEDKNVDLKDIKIVKKLGGTIDDTELVDGLIFTSHKIARGGPSRIEKPKIALIQFCVTAPKTDIENNIVVKDYSGMDRIMKEERKYIVDIVKKIAESGAQILLIQKSILRDAVNEMSLHFLGKKDIIVVKDIERDEIDFISKTIGAIPVAHIDQLTPDKLGTADLFEEITLSDDSKILKITGGKKPSKTVSILVRGSNNLVLDEAERSLHDALCVVRSYVCGGGAIEIEIAQKLAEYAKTLPGAQAICVRAFSESLEIIPYSLAENAGMSPINVVTDLRNRHINGDKLSGISLKKYEIANMKNENIIQPALITQSALTLATEFVRMILKIDDIVLTAR